jgi:tRNA/tmRNA/rRNA uracil-C5-methylase (TrmA/RlmC/RlmD family)
VTLLPFSTNFARFLGTPFDVETTTTFLKHSARKIVGGSLFEYATVGFFQKNDFVLPLMVNYVRGLIFTCVARITHVFDPCSGGGPFAISLAPGLQKVAGIEFPKPRSLLPGPMLSLTPCHPTKNILPLH